MPFLALYWKHLLALVLVLAAGWKVYDLGGKAARLECAQAKLDALQEQQQLLRDAQQEAAEANEALRKELRKPKPGRTIREVVSANPSDCRIDPAVSASVQDAIREANRRAAK